MGDIADWLLSSQQPDFGEDPFGDDGWRPPPKPKKHKKVTCKYCNQSGFEWVFLQGKWRLCGRGTILNWVPHTCSQYKGVK